MHCQNSQRFKLVALVAIVPALVLALTGCAPQPPDDPPPPQPLPVTIEPEDSGTVTQTFDGDNVTLTAVAEEGWEFDVWSGSGVTDTQANPLTVSRNDVASLTANFTEEAVEPPADADNDGVADDVDECDDTPAGADVNAVGCPDTDGDGVADNLDQCDDTPAGTAVNAVGCPDADDDGVANDEDDCPDSPAGEEVDEEGCADSQLDSDDDGVNDAIDQCPTTPADVSVDEEGCPISAPGTGDEDDDGVPDDIDQCEDTPPDTTVDANGCADADGDGIADTEDDCPETPADAAEVNLDGCADSELDTDGDGVTDDLDECANTPRGTTVDATGCPTTPGGGGGGGGGTSPTCGDGTVDDGEECDDGNTTDGDGCAANCTWELNDSCNAPRSVGRGTISFDTTGATTDGSLEPTPECALSGYSQLGADIWYCFNSPCTDNVIVSLCGSSYDTKLAVYQGCGCPSELSIACSDDDCGPGVRSRVSFPAVTGESYMIRVGGYQDDQGTGTMSIYCEGDPDIGANACGVDSGECFENNGTPGCVDETCCTATCEVDPFCCDTEWDSVCAEKAEEVMCRDTPPAACGSGAGDCTAVGGNGSAGCEDEVCCQLICEFDPFCCLTEWDDLCAEDASFTCE